MMKRSSCALPPGYLKIHTALERPQMASVKRMLVMAALAASSFLTTSLPILCLASYASLSPPPLAAATDGTLLIEEDTFLLEDHVGNIVLGADGVTLDCRAYTVTAPDPGGSGIGITLTGREDVTVRNCRVSGFYIGIAVDESSHNDLIRNYVTDCEVGFAVGGVKVSRQNLFHRNTTEGNGIGYFLTGLSSDNLLSKNSAANNGNGFLITDSPNNILVDNLAHHNAEGFFVTSSSPTVLVSNRASSNGRGELGSGFRLEGPGHIVLRNIAVENDIHGFDLHGCTESLLRKNQARSNGFSGFSLVDATANRLEKNHAWKNALHGFFIGGFFGSFDNEFSKNRARRNGGFDAIQEPPSSGNVFLENRFGTTSGI